MGHMIGMDDRLWNDGTGTVNGSGAAREHQRAVGKPTRDAEGIDRPDGLDSELARAALIGERAVEKAIGHHPAPRLQRRADSLGDVIRPRRREQQGLGARRPAIGRTLQQQATDRLRPLAAAGFARLDDVMTPAAQSGGQGPDLGRFPDALAALQRDETPPRHA